MKAFKFVLINTLFISLVNFILIGKVYADGEVSGGVDPTQEEQNLVKTMIISPALKGAMFNYLHTLVPSEIEDLKIKKFFENVITIESLKSDIHNSQYLPKENCEDFYNNKVPVSTFIGKLGADVCFDVFKLAKIFKTLSEEEAMIRLASYAFHEHVHHFQNPTKEIMDNEQEAYQLSTYIRLTAKVAQLPTLVWSNPPDVKNCQNFSGIFVSPEVQYRPGVHNKFTIKKIESDTYSIRVGPQSISRNFVVHGNYKVDNMMHVAPNDSEYSSDPNNPEKFYYAYTAKCTSKKLTITIEESLNYHEGSYFKAGWQKKTWEMELVNGNAYISADYIRYDLNKNILEKSLLSELYTSE